jgi:hypothetical protein
MDNHDKNAFKRFGYQPEIEKRGYQPSVNTQNNTQNSSATDSEPPKGGNVAQKD